MTDAQWLCIHSFLITCSYVRVGKETRCLLFIEALRWMARMGAPWHQLPAAYGKGNWVYRRYAHWCDRGIRPRRLAYLQADLDRSAVRRDSTVVRAHVSAAGTPQKKEAEPALDRSQGGFSTQIHILADRRGRPPRLHVTGGQCHDRIQPRGLGEAWIDNTPVLPDRGPGL